MINHALPPDSPAGRDVMDKYRIGYVAEPLPGDDRFRGMMSLPYLTPKGCRALRFRRLDGGKPKIAQSEGQKPRLYNTRAYFDADDTVGITEGEIDAIVATERLRIPSIGVPGAEMWSGNAPVWLPVFKDFRQVLVFADGDPVNKATGLRPGWEFARQVASAIGWRAQIIKCPEGQDVSSMVAAGRMVELTDQFQLVGDED